MPAATRLPEQPAATGQPAGHLLHAAACEPLTAVFSGPERSAQVVVATTKVVAVRVADADPGLICLTTAPGSVLPCAVTLPGALPVAPAGTYAVAGAGQLRLPGVRIVPVRWQRVRRPRVTDAALAAERATRQRPPDTLRGVDGAFADRADSLAAALAGPAVPADPAVLIDDIDQIVRGLLGLGPGLTPLGDDVLAGALVAARATAHPALGRLTAAVRQAQPYERTTAMSAGLLQYAARGYAVAQLGSFVAALGASGTAGSAAAVDHTRQALLRVGHTSGAGYLLGAVAALRSGCRPARSWTVVAANRAGR